MSTVVYMYRRHEDAIACNHQSREEPLSPGFKMPSPTTKFGWLLLQARTKADLNQAFYAADAAATQSNLVSIPPSAACAEPHLTLLNNAFLPCC